MQKVSLYGAGFVGGEYAKTYSDEVEVLPRDWDSVPTPNILNFMSTVHNYNVLTDPWLDIRTNLTEFIQLLETGRRKWGKGLIVNHVSSWFVYGKTNLPSDEESPCNPTGFYSITKLASEQLLKSYCETFDLKFRILRLGNVIGVGDKKVSRKKNALQHMIRELAQGRDIDYLYKDGAIRDYIDVRDCVSAIHLVLEKGEYNQTYNIANGQGLNVNDLVNVAWKESDYKSKVTQIPVPDFHRTVQTPKMWMDVSKIKKLGYVQQYDIKQSVRSLVHYYEKNEI